MSCRSRIAAVAFAVGLVGSGALAQSVAPPATSALPELGDGAGKARQGR